jgi:hypothetical protein
MIDDIGTLSNAKEFEANNEVLGIFWYGSIKKSKTAKSELKNSYTLHIWRNM